ncbi:hypothetical protein BDQ17DRAFT_1422504 [Cyathus striatus]|nr:hypothetical protein BDQ17DRAFT_1422504 [Cyathus striatus]
MLPTKEAVNPFSRLTHLPSTNLISVFSATTSNTSCLTSSPLFMCRHYPSELRATPRLSNAVRALVLILVVGYGYGLALHAAAVSTAIPTFTPDIFTATATILLPLLPLLNFSVPSSTISTSIPSHRLQSSLTLQYFPYKPSYTAMSSSQPF